MWWQVADWVWTKVCRERQRVGYCGCRSKRYHNWNPCDRAERVKVACEAYAQGLPASMTVEEILRWAIRHTCHKSQEGHVCSHRACGDAQQYIEFLQGTLAAKKAA